MDEFLQKINNLLSIENVSKSLIILNLTSIVLGIIYLAIEVYNIVWDIFGVILLITLFGNILLVYLNTTQINRTTKLGNRINLLCYFYLVYMVFAMLFMVGGNMLIQMNYESDILSNLRHYFMLFAGYFGVLGFALIIAYLDFKNLDNREIWDLQNVGPVKQTESTRKIKAVLKTILGIFCLFLMANGVYFVFLLFFGAPMGLQPFTQSDFVMELSFPINITADMIGPGIGGLNGVIGMIVSEFALFFSIVMLCTAALYLKMIDKRKRPELYYAVAIIGLTTSGLLLTPLLSTPYYIMTAEQSFAAAFGDDWRSNIDATIERNYFLQSYYSPPGYFLGARPKDCNLQTDVLFFNGSLSNFTQDEDITLYFDVYYPKGSASTMPGEGSVLIWIHGGGWMLGGKGNYRVGINKYFAAQGYIVYDIEYGLRRLPIDLGDGALTPVRKVGDFDISDMVRHIGNFTQYIANATNSYSASSLGGVVSKTLIQGGSAGGLLTCATALGIESGLYPQYFHPSINIIGFVPYYPGNGIPDMINMGGDDKLINPEKLIDGNSPPSLMFHGTSDGLASPEISKIFQNAYIAAGSTKCAILWAPFAGHAADIYNTGYYNQVFTYYMERFMYLCVNGFI